MAESNRFKGMRTTSPDNFQTPAYALDYLYRSLPLKSRIWEPACGKGNLVKALQAKGYDVVASDILYGEEFDFMTYRPDRFDMIVTNPPFSIKLKFIGRCYHLKVPFALLLPLTCLQHAKIRQLFQHYGVEFIFPRARIDFETPNHEKRMAENKESKSWFYSVWVTCGLHLGDNLNFTEKKEARL